ncbi:ribosome biosynthesis protein rrb1, partial [Physocladia obscura]
MKRQAEAERHKEDIDADMGSDDEGMGEFEDNWIDDVEHDSEDGDVVVDAGDEELDGDGDDDGIGVDADGDGADGVAADADVKVFLPGDALQDGEVLVADNSAYEMLHQMHVEWPCLSFDILRDQLGQLRKHFPMAAYIVAGSQAEKQKDNKLYVMKMSDLHRTKHDDDDGMNDDSDSDDDDNLDEDPILEFKTVPHHGGVNRVRAMQHPESHIVASWSEYGKVHIWDLTTVVASLDTPGVVSNVSKPIYTVDRHNKVEGLLTGDINGKIYHTSLHSNSSFQTDGQAFTGHRSSIEDLQWSPAEESVFASCSADGTIRVWDVRTRNKAQLSWQAHNTDVNVISWNRLTDRLLASGSDSGEFSVWDFRTISTNMHQKQQPQATAAAAASFNWHRKPITSIEWHPAESSVLAVSGDDDQITLWDLALERDAEEEPMMANVAAATRNDGNGGKVEVPPQLLFIHQGQESVKEIHWHPQCPGVLVSTALNG